jgi:hypothetical protein
MIFRMSLCETRPQACFILADKKKDHKNWRESREGAYLLLHDSQADTAEKL